MKPYITIMVILMTPRDHYSLFVLFVKCFGVCFRSPHSSESRVITYMCFPCILQR